MIGRYELVAELARGGMGDVHLAVSHGPHGFRRVTVVKVIHPDLAHDPLFVDMFMREARLTGEKVLEEARNEEARIVSEMKTIKRTRRQLAEDLRATLTQYQRMFAGDLLTGGDDDEGRS